jgi:hypothetical protein
MIQVLQYRSTVTHEWRTQHDISLENRRTNMKMNWYMRYRTVDRHEQVETGQDDIKTIAIEIQDFGS